jgi:hypothetical protein
VIRGTAEVEIVLAGSKDPEEVPDKVHTFTGAPCLRRTFLGLPRTLMQHRVSVPCRLSIPRADSLLRAVVSELKPMAG